MFGLFALALMVVCTFMYFNELGLVKVLAFWGAYIVTGILPFVGVSPMMAGLGGMAVAGAFFVVAKSA